MSDNYWPQAMRVAELEGRPPWQIAVDPALDNVVIYRHYGDTIQILYIEPPPSTKPEAEWEGGNWLFHVAKGCPDLWMW